MGHGESNYNSIGDTNLDNPTTRYETIHRSYK